jgi:flagellar basal-body rod protein FlgG
MNSLYGTPATGMRGAEFQLDITANNIANVDTSGYQSVEGVLGALPDQPEIGDPDNGSLPSSATYVGMGTAPASVERSTAQAPLVRTGNPLDLAISGPGFFVVRQASGQTAYTSQLSLHVQPDGKVLTASGLATVPPIQVPATVTAVVARADGTLVGTTRAGQTITVGKPDIAVFAAPANLLAQGGGLYTETLSSGRPQTRGTGPDTKVLAGYQLGSTVDLAAEMVNMIQEQRMFELNTKALQTLDSLVNSTISLQTR